MHQSGARLSERDVADLNQASDQLAVAAQAIRRANPNWGESVVALLILANTSIVRVRDKGAAAFARYLERHGVAKPQDALEAPAACIDSPSSPIASPGEEER